MADDTPSAASDLLKMGERLGPDWDREFREQFRRVRVLLDDINSDSRLLPMAERLEIEAALAVAIAIRALGSSLVSAGISSALGGALGGLLRVAGEPELGRTRPRDPKKVGP